MLPLTLAAVLATNATPPLIVQAKVEGGQLVTHRAVTRQVPVTETRTVTVNGTPVTQTVTVLRQEMRTQVVKHDLKKSTLTDGEGNKLTLAAVTKRLEKLTPVVLSLDGKPVDAAFLKVLKKDAIVIAVPLDEPKVTPAAEPVEKGP